MKGFIIVTLLFILYLALDLIFNEVLWELNTEFTIYLQQHDSKLLIFLFNFFSNWLDIFPGLALLIFALTDKKYEALIYFCLIQFIISFNSALKNIYHQPRPYWVEYEIKALSCNKEFGKPSGHAMQSLMMCLMLPILLVRSQIKIRNIILYIIVIIWAFMTALSRIYLGMHSIGQILLGWAYTLYLIFCYTKYIHKNIIKFLKLNLTSTNNLQWNHILIVILVSLTYYCFCLIFYIVNRFVWNRNSANEWLQVIYQKCQDQDYLYNHNDAQVLQNFCLKQTFEMTFILFLILWIKLCNGSYDQEKYSYNYSKTTWQFKLLRLLILIILLLPVKLLEFVNSHNIWTMIFCYTIPWNLIVSFLLIIAYRELLKNFKFNLDGDFMQVNLQDGYTNF